MGTEDRLVTVERKGHLAIVTIDRAESLNALSNQLSDQLASIAIELSADGDVWVIVLTATGDRAFCVGADLKERVGNTFEETSRGREVLNRLFDSWSSVPQPTIAAVFGHTLGGGLELALCCDLLIAADETSLGLPEARAGLIPAGRGTWRLAHAVGPVLSRRMIYTAQPISAHEALELGLVAVVVPRSEVLGTAVSLGEEIMASSPFALRHAKGLLKAAFVTSEPELRELEQESWLAVAQSTDRIEGIAAFNEKRSPSWANT
jgi:enoyl-CoA hydratase/carnithine racemase